MSKTNNKEIVITAKEAEKAWNAFRAANEVRQVLQLREENVKAIIELLDDRYGTNIAGGMHTITPDGKIVPLSPRGVQTANESE